MSACRATFYTGPRDTMYWCSRPMGHAGTHVSTPELFSNIPSDVEDALKALPRPMRWEAS